nr:hypothetical protein [Tanacetum cinerariifolium]
MNVKCDLKEILLRSNFFFFSSIAVHTSGSGNSILLAVATIFTGKVIEISSGTEELECTSTEELESSSTSELESSSTEDDSDDEEFSSSSAELVTCIPVSTKKSFSDDFEDDTNEEAEDDKDDSDDETLSPKTIGTASKSIISPNKKGATSSSRPSTKKKLVNRGEPVRHCIIGLANPRTWDMIVKKDFGFKKEEVKKQVNKSKEQVNKGKRKMYD